ncbi:elongator complex protein 1 isoform X2 [Impatiens glandulifera]|nr:elongator complex protein 1 isoform X2 [Impatiens glandulifera]
MIPNSSTENPLSWRGDGKYFATLSTAQESSSLHKKIKVWERDSGALHSVSESKGFMGAVLEWMPSGAKIASVYDKQHENNCPSVVFFERNGLERSSFSINEESNAVVNMMKWNSNSDLLAAIVRCKQYDLIKIWFFSNNHWYLKKEIRYSKEDSIRVMWDPTNPMQLICWTAGGQITVCKFSWVTAVMENSTALVIDGYNMFLTPLSLSLIPPPMYLFKLRFPSPISDIAFTCKGSKNHLAASLSDGSLSIVELPSVDTWEEFEGKEFIIDSCYSDTEVGSLRHIQWLDSHVLLGVAHYGSKHSGRPGYYLQEIEIVCSENHIPDLVTSSGWHLKNSSNTFLEEVVIGIVPNLTKKYSAYVQFDGGKVFNYTSKLGLVPCFQRDDDKGFPTSCPLMNVVSVGDNVASNYLLFGLDESYRLHVNGRVLCNNCSSFAFYSCLADQVITHIVLATKQDLLFIVDIGDLLNGDLEVNKYENFMPVFKRRNEEENRKYGNIWERGARIIGVIHGDEAAVILQTVRGNLECIFPRKLVLNSIINALEQNRFSDAFHMVRRHRIDFNVIVDHSGWQAFSKIASEFVRQVKNLSHVTEFVCAMKNENVMETLYKIYLSLPGQNLDKGYDSDSKLNSVLLAIRNALEDHIEESPARELCILTTLARSNPPALEEALKRIKVIRELELSDSNYPKRNTSPSAEEALKHLLWLSEAEPVYEAALGLYDLNLAAIVAINSQRDPKEFLPFLQELEQKPSQLMRYSIDLKLQRYKSALKHIITAGDPYFADSMDLMKKNPQLFPLGLQLINNDPAKRKQVLEAWGDHLNDIKHFDVAATTYLCCTNLEKALKAYRACGNWSGVLTVAGLTNLGKEEVLQLATEICEELNAMGKPREAAKLAIEYCGDVVNGVGLLITARDWEEALRIAFMYKRDDLVSEVKNGAIECANLLIGEYEEGLEKVGKYLTRYLAIRQRRILLEAKLRLEDTMTEVDDDVSSQASSNFSGMSAYTTGTRKGSAASIISSSASSRARDARRQRNKGKIRAGSPGEEIALVDHLKGMSLTSGSKSELKSLLISLLMVGEEATAKKLQRSGENFQVAQMAAVKLAEDSSSSEVIDEQAHCLDSYVEKTRRVVHVSEEFSWRLEVLISSISLDD